MFALLSKRLGRSMMKSRTRLVAVVAMVLVAVFAGISFAAYAHTVSGVNDKIYDDSEQGVILPDIWSCEPTLKSIFVNFATGCR